MPAYRISDPRHPASRCRLLHLALLELQEEGAYAAGKVHSVDDWETMVSMVTGVMVPSAIKAYTTMMRRFGMIRQHPGDGVEVLGRDHLRIAHPSPQVVEAVA